MNVSVCSIQRAVGSGRGHKEPRAEERDQPNTKEDDNNNNNNNNHKTKSKNEGKEEANVKREGAKKDEKGQLAIDLDIRPMEIDDLYGGNIITTS